MNNTKSESLSLVDICDDLFHYSINREDMKLILNNMQKNHNDNNHNILEYELQILKIIIVGWAISFFMFDKPKKDILLKTFWNKIQIFSADLSSVLILTSTKNVNYFDVLKQRTDIYVNAIESGNASIEPINIIGPKFAEICNLKNNANIILAASKLFKLTIDDVKLYLHSL